MLSIYYFKKIHVYLIKYKFKVNKFEFMRSTITPMHIIIHSKNKNYLLSYYNSQIKNSPEKESKHYIKYASVSI